MNPFTASLGSASSLFSKTEQTLSITTFQSDVTPPLGATLCNGNVSPVKRIVNPLSARGIVFLTGDQPIVLCAVDWVVINNGAHDEWRSLIAEAVGTTIDRVTVHNLHPHDTIGCDFSTEKLLAENGLSGAMFDPDFVHDAIARNAKAAGKAMESAQPVTHLGMGRAKVEKFASTRRVMGPDGKVKYARMSSCRDEKGRAETEGVIDPYVRSLSLWNGDDPVASLTYYATHPQSFYGRGGVSYDTVGVARAIREATLPGAAHIHFDGASGNVAAGKYNDGSPVNRFILARRLVDGMEAAWEATEKVPIKASDVEWRVKPVALPLRDTIGNNIEKLREQLANSETERRKRVFAARNLAWAERCTAGRKIDLTCLRLGPAYILHMPGELFVEYQLAAQDMRPDDMVCMAAYGDCGPGYIGTEIAYSQGGYETGFVSRTAPHVESVLMNGMRELLGVDSDQ